MMKDLEIAFTAKEITTFGGVSLLYNMLDNCHFKEALSSVGLPQQGSNRGKSPEQPIYGLFTGARCGASRIIHCWHLWLSGTGLEEAPPNHYGQTGNR
ncbi:MAG: hypothetical protein K6G32_02775 [Prevotella sp.]|jgi:hypothetical protein|nr:hypothetical protein [Prevotella sp.]